MHEMGIASELLSAVLDAAEREGASRVNIVSITVGELTEVVPDALQFAWEALRTGTAAGEAELEITEVPARSRCLQCGEEFSHDRFHRICPSCGGVLVEVLEGNELRVDSVDVD